MCELHVSAQTLRLTRHLFHGLLACLSRGTSLLGELFANFPVAVAFRLDFYWPLCWPLGFLCLRRFLLSFRIRGAGDWLFIFGGHAVEVSFAFERFALCAFTRDESFEA